MSFFLLLWYCLSFFDVTSITITYLISSHVVSRIKPLSTIFQLYRGGHRSTVSQYSSLSYIYLCNKCLSSTKVAGSILIMSRCTRHNILVFNIIVWVTFTCVRSVYHPLRWRDRFWSCLGVLETTFSSIHYISLSYIYLCNKCLSSIKVAGSILIMSRCTRHNILVFTILVWVTFTCVRSVYHLLKWRVRFWSCLGVLDTTF